MSVPTSVPTSRPDVAPAWSRHLLLAGPAYAVLLVLAAALFPAPPGGDVAVGLDARWLTHHTGAVIGQAYLRGLASLAFVVLGVAVATLCRRVMPSAPLAAAALAGSVLCGGLLLLAQTVALATAQFARHSGGAAAAHALGQLQAALLDMSSLPATLLFGAVGVAVLHSDHLPRWFGWFSLLGVPFALLDAGSYDGGPLAALSIVGLVYFLVWTLVGGVLLHRATREVPAST